MKKYLLPFLIIGVLLGGCASVPDKSQSGGTKASEDLEVMQQTHAPDGSGTEKNADIVRGVDKVLSIIKEVEKRMEDTTEAKSLNKIGSQMEEEWDIIEKSVEKTFPEDYTNIEKSLYPLMAELQKTLPDLAKIKDLSDQTKAKLDLFKIKARQ